MGSGRRGARRWRRTALGAALCPLAAAAIGLLAPMAMANPGQPSSWARSLAASDELGRVVFSHRRRTAAPKVAGGEEPHPADDPKPRDTVAEWLSHWWDEVERTRSD